MRGKASHLSFFLQLPAQSVDCRALIRRAFGVLDVFELFVLLTDFGFCGLEVLHCFVKVLIIRNKSSYIVRGMVRVQKFTAFVDLRVVRSWSTVLTEMQSPYPL